MEQPVQGSGHSTELPEFKGCLVNALRHRVWIWGRAVWRLELDLMILIGPFQLGMFCHSNACFFFINPTEMLMLAEQLR